MLITLITLLIIGRYRITKILPPDSRMAEALEYCRRHGMNTEMCILVDYGLHSGMNRLFVWSFAQNKMLFTCPVSHGKGHFDQSLRKPRFSNDPKSWLSSLGMCRIAEHFESRHGSAYRIDGLEDSNSNMRLRKISLHAHWSITSYPINPFYSRGSRGCLKVSTFSMRELDALLEDKTDVLLYIFNSKQA